jgi:7-cyano-7-deazaguanine synthase
MTACEEKILPKRQVSKTVVILSGGMDSTTLLYDRRSRGEEVYPISFFYGQKHKREIHVAKQTCNKLGLFYKYLDISALGGIAPSALTRGDIGIPKGGYQDESMKQTVVPNRNMVFLAFATAYAVGLDADTVVYGAHGGDHAIYPDCRPAFVDAMEKAIGLCDYKTIKLLVPYLYWTKEEILRRGLELGVDYSLTWTCYEGGDLACGQCGSCTERLEAFKKVGIEDPIKYKER